MKQLVQRKKIADHLQELRKESKIDADKLTAALTAYATTPKEPAKDAPLPTSPRRQRPAGERRPKRPPRKRRSPKRLA